MVEGGAGMIGGCVRGRLAHRAVLTIAPTLVGGLRPGYAPPAAEAAAAAAVVAVGGGGVAAGGESGDAYAPQLRLRAVQSFPLGEDVVVSGELV